MVEKFLFKRKPAVLITLGSAAGFLVGGAIAWNLLQRRPTLVGMPIGSEVIPQEAVMTLSVSTDKSQWQQFRRFGTPETQKALDQKLAQWRDRLLIANGLNYQRDIQPWVGPEITAAVLMPPTDAKTDQQVQPYNPEALAAGEQATVLVLPIADPAKAQQVLAKPKLAATQDWVERDYQGIKIREVHGQKEHAYAAAVLGDQFIVVANETSAIEATIDTFKGKASVAQAPGYSQALGHISPTNSFLHVYANIPAAVALTSHNANQPIPPQILAPLKNNQGFAAAMNLESEGIRLQGVSWLAPNRKTRFKVTNNAEQMPLILPSSSLLAASGGNLKQLWQNYTQQPDETPQTGLWNPDTLRQGVNNLTGLDLDQDLIPWMGGEYALAVVSQPASEASTPAKAGVMLLVEASDRKAAEQTFQRLDQLMKTRYRFQVNQAQVAGQPVTNWVSPFTSLSVSHGWMDGNVAFLAIGPDLASTLIPKPEQPLATNPLFRQTTSTDLTPNNGHFFLDLDRLTTPNLNLPLPQLPAQNQALLKAMRSIGVTAALQDGRTTRYDIRVLLRKGDTPGALPAPAPGGDEPAATSPEASPAE